MTPDHAGLPPPPCRCWGYNGNSQLGDGTTTTYAIPKLIDAATDWAVLNLGDDTSCSLKSNGSLYCWGQNTDGQL